MTEAKVAATKAFERKLAAAKRASTLHLLFQVARLQNERALNMVPEAPGPRSRAAHLSLLPHIDLGEGTRVTDLAEKLGITKQAVGQLVDDLEEMGAVARVPDPEDGRAKRVVFTENGRESMLRGLKHLIAMEPRIRQVLGPRLLKSFREALLLLLDETRQD